MSTADVILDPLEIEKRSFEIIDAEVGEHDFDKRQWQIVRRIIHTSADFDFADSTLFAAGVIDTALAAIRRGEPVLCDTRMVAAGVNKRRMGRFGSDLRCHVGDEDVASAAQGAGVTRSIMAMRKGVEGGCGIYLVGNAPTALYELLAQADSGAVQPSLVVGVPVGFVGAAESKEALQQSALPFITCRGRKGGSAIAAAVMNALLILAEEESP
ncbi:MAG: precorrin-8X methylmutase [Desulfuromonadales bacterium]